MSEKDKFFFDNFSEYWRLTRHLTEDQRKIIHSSLSDAEVTHLRKSYENGKWRDIVMRNACDGILDVINEKFGVDLLQLRMDVLSGKPKLVKSSFWNYIVSSFSDTEHVDREYIFGGLKVSQADNEDYVKIEKAN